MGVVDSVKEVAQLAKNIGDIELYRQILDLQSEVLELTQDNYGLQKEVQDLKEELTQSREMTYQKPVYRVQGDDTPFCAKCWEVDQVAVHLDGPREFNYSSDTHICRKCNERYIVG